MALLCISLCGLTVSAPVHATPPGWRAHGHGPIQAGPFQTKPLSEDRGSVRALPPTLAEAAAAAITPEAEATAVAPSSLIAPMSATASSDADYRTPELIALAAGLKNDRDLIFAWVRDNIRYVHYHGC